MKRGICLFEALVEDIEHFFNLSDDKASRHYISVHRTHVLTLAIQQRVSDRQFGVGIVLVTELVHQLEMVRTTLPVDAPRPYGGTILRACKRAARLHSELQRLNDGNVDLVTLLNQAVVPARAATRITQTAAWVLPAAERVRYDNEYRSELYELAAAGASWWRQLLHALRTLDQAWVLRAELRASVARRAQP